MDAPCSEINLTSSQFDILVEIVKTIRVQTLNGQSGKIEFEGLIELSWDAAGVKMEMKATKT